MTGEHGADGGGRDAPGGHGIHGSGEAGADGTLRDALREALPEPVAEAVEWDRLVLRIGNAAAPALAARRTAAAAWWRHAARWSRVGIPLAAAAALALAAVLPRTGTPGATLPAAGPTAPASGVAAGAGGAGAAAAGPSAGSSPNGASSEPTLAYLDAGDPGAALLAAALDGTEED